MRGFCWLCFMNTSSLAVRGLNSENVYGKCDICRTHIFLEHVHFFTFKNSFIGYNDKYIEHVNSKLINIVSIIDKYLNSIIILEINLKSKRLHKTLIHRCNM